MKTKSPSEVRARVVSIDYAVNKLDDLNAPTPTSMIVRCLWFSRDVVSTGSQHFRLESRVHACTRAHAHTEPSPILSLPLPFSSLILLTTHNAPPSLPFSLTPAPPHSTSPFTTPPPPLNPLTKHPLKIAPLRNFTLKQALLLSPCPCSLPLLPPSSHTTQHSTPHRTPHTTTTTTTTRTL